MRIFLLAAHTRSGEFNCSNHALYFVRHPTNIGLTLTNAGKVRVNIHDIHGRAVAGVIFVSPHPHRVVRISSPLGNALKKYIVPP